MRFGPRRAAAVGVCSLVVSAVTAGTAGPSHAEVSAAVPPWAGFAANAQHTATAPATPQPLTRVHWHVPVDLRPNSVPPDGAVAHYASPMITSADTVVVPTRLGPRRGFELVAYAGADGARRWALPTDYTVPVGAKREWPPPLPAGLVDDSRVAVAGAGGTLLVRSHVNRAHGAVRRFAFYGLGRWRAHRAGYRAAVQVTTPLTTGPDGSLYFGFSAASHAPGHLRSGLARIAPDGHGSWVSARRLAGSRLASHVARNCAPALSPDGRTAYVAVLTGKDGSRLVSLDAATLRPLHRHLLRDPQSGHRATVFESSSATPTVGPDGDIFYGVLGNPVARHDARGWLLHFGPHLRRVEDPGSFGWDQTVSVVPSASVPGYSGHSSYLLVSKYNNYDAGPHGDGRNELALLDPHASQRDEYSRVRVLREVRTVLSPRRPPGTPADSRYEWCINSVAVDPTTGSAIANNEDGHLYRWDLGSGQLVDDLRLGKPRGQAYTETVVGPDGTSYAIENATLYAVGS